MNHLANKETKQSKWGTFNAVEVQGAKPPRPFLDYWPDEKFYEATNYEKPKALKPLDACAYLILTAPLAVGVGFVYWLMRRRGKDTPTEVVPASEEPERVGAKAEK